MSQGIIIRRGHGVPSAVHVLKGTVSCDECEDKFDLFHHVAHIEDEKAQGAWLDAQLKTEHDRGPERKAEHKDSYLYPDAGKIIVIPSI